MDLLGNLKIRHDPPETIAKELDLDRRLFSGLVSEKNLQYQYQVFDCLAIRRCIVLNVIRNVSMGCNDEGSMGELSEFEGRYAGQLGGWSAEDLLWTGAEFKRAVQTLAEEPGIGTHRIRWNGSAERGGGGSWYGLDADRVWTPFAAHSVRLLWLRMKQRGLPKPPVPFQDWISHAAWVHNQTAGKGEYDLEVRFRAPITWGHDPQERLISHMIWNRSIAGDEAVSIDLVRYLAEYNHLLPELSWRQFEELIAEILARMGFTVNLMPGSRDGGKDLVAIIPVSPAPNLLFVQCKHYPVRKVRIEAVQAFEAVVNRRGDGARGLIVTSGWFTKGGVAWVEDAKSRLSLVDYDVLIGWLHRYGWAKQTEQSLVGDKSESRSAYPGDAPDTWAPPMCQ